MPNSFIVNVAFEKICIDNYRAPLTTTNDTKYPSLVFLAFDFLLLLVSEEAKLRITDMNLGQAPLACFASTNS
jgi:hypothetical protein